MATSQKNVFGVIRYHHHWRQKSYLSSSELQMQITAHKGNGCIKSSDFLLFAPLPPPPRGGREKKSHHKKITQTLLLTF